MAAFVTYENNSLDNSIAAGQTLINTAPTVAGGSTNTASGFASMIPGGQQNTAAGPASFAAGTRAKANHDGAFCWAELGTRDTAKAGSFYSAVFGWGLKSGSVPGMNYTEWQLGKQSIGGMMDITGMPGLENVPPHWLIYFAVKDCDAAAAKAASLGAKIAVQPTDIPHVGRFSVVADPQGAAFAVIHITAMG